MEKTGKKSCPNKSFYELLLLMTLCFPIHLAFSLSIFFFELMTLWIVSLHSTWQIYDLLVYSFRKVVGKKLRYLSMLSLNGDVCFIVSENVTVFIFPTIKSLTSLTCGVYASILIWLENDVFIWKKKKNLAQMCFLFGIIKPLFKGKRINFNLLHLIQCLCVYCIVYKVYTNTR